MNASRIFFPHGSIVFLVLAAFYGPSHAQSSPVAPPPSEPFLQRFVAAAMERTHHAVRYVPAYVRIPYPNGDVPADTGVCTDEVIRSYRVVGVDLQKEVHEDMQRHFSAYPNQARWQLSHTDTNIDHRRVPNLMVFFSRMGETLTLSNEARDYHPGDLVTWDLGGNVPHIGIVVGQKSPSSGRFLIVHNIGQGPQDGRRPLPLENHRPLPLSRSQNDALVAPSAG